MCHLPMVTIFVKALKYQMCEYQYWSLFQPQAMASWLHHDMHMFLDYITGHLWEESTGHQCISHTKGQ